MPAKGKYLLNCQELKNEALYRKFSCNSQYQPLVLLLGLSMLACGILLILFFALGLVSPDVLPLSAVASYIGGGAGVNVYGASSMLSPCTQL